MSESRPPGFSLGRHHFVPGFPQMGWPMFEWVLDNEYPHLQRAGFTAERLLLLPGTSEGAVVDLLDEFVATGAGVELSCLPHFEGEYRETELGLRGAAGAVDAGIDWLRARLDERGVAWREVTGS